MRIFGWAGDRGGCAYWRLQLPLTGLRDLGHHVEVSTGLPQHVADGQVDVLIAQRLIDPHASTVFRALADRADMLCVLDLDDDLWSIPADNLTRTGYGPTQLGELQRNLAAAHLVTVSTEPLAARVAEFTDSPVAVLPNCVPDRLLDHQRPRRDRLTLGWAGSPTHGRDFGEAARPVQRVLAARPDVVGHIIGPDYRARIVSDRATVRHTPWFPNVETYLRRIDFDIGIVPLRPNVFNDSKSDLKLLEYSALGIPTVATHTGPHLAAAEAGAPARWVPPNAHPRWRAELLDLIDNPDARTELGKAAHDWATTRAISRHAHRWAEAYTLNRKEN